MFLAQPPAISDVTSHSIADMTMNKAAQLAEKLGGLSVVEGMKLIDEWNRMSLYFDVIDDAMCIMHSDGSVNIIDSAGKGILTVEVVSAANVLKVLKHYRPFKDLFGGQIQ